MAVSLIRHRWNGEESPRLPIECAPAKPRGYRIDANRENTEIKYLVERVPRPENSTSTNGGGGSGNDSCTVLIAARRHCRQRREFRCEGIVMNASRPNNRADGSRCSAIDAKNHEIGQFWKHHLPSVLSRRPQGCDANRLDQLPRPPSHDRQAEHQIFGRSADGYSETKAAAPQSCRGPPKPTEAG